MSTNEPKKVSTDVMETISGKPVYILGIAGYTLEQKTGATTTRLRARAYAWDSKRNRVRRLEKAEEAVGEPCHWVKGQQSQYFDVHF